MLLRDGVFRRKEKDSVRAAPRPSRSNLSLFVGERPFREARLRAYIISQHRTGRPLSAILEDAYVRRCGSESFRWRVLRDPRTIQALEHNIHQAFEDCRRRR